MLVEMEQKSMNVNLIKIRFFIISLQYSEYKFCTKLFLKVQLLLVKAVV